MTERYTTRAKKVLELALREALSLGHNYIGTEHILLALTQPDPGIATAVLHDAGLTHDVALRKVKDILVGPGRRERITVNGITYERVPDER